MALQKIDHPPADNAVNKPMDVFRFSTAIGYEMNVIRHYHIRKDEEVSGLSCLPDGVAK
jgi:hypothetical protein